MIKTLLLISGLALLGPGTGGLELSNPISKFEFQISHLELSLDSSGAKPVINSDSKLGFKLTLQSAKTIDVRF